MPYYEYRCPSNGRTVEVRHGMSEFLETWGEVTRHAGIETGATPTDSPVERLLSAPIPLTGSGGQADFQGCGAGCACARSA